MGHTAHQKASFRGIYQVQNEIDIESHIAYKPVKFNCPYMASFQRRFNQIAVEGNARISDYIPDNRKYKDYVCGRC